MEASVPPYLTVSKKSSKEQWYCADPSPVVRLSTKYTFLAWNGLGPRLSPNLALGDHLGRVEPEARAFERANTGQPKVCIFDIFAPILMPEKASSLEVPSSSIGRQFAR